MAEFIHAVGLAVVDPVAKFKQCHVTLFEI